MWKAGITELADHEAHVQYKMWSMRAWDIL